MKTILLFSLLVVGLFQCDRDKDVSCEASLISHLKTEPVRNPPAELWRYGIDGATYYYITAYCCDMYSDLYDENCTLICHPDGGITGSGDGKCGELTAGLAHGILVWRDERK